MYPSEGEDLMGVFNFICMSLAVPEGSFSREDAYIYKYMLKVPCIPEITVSYHSALVQC